MSAINKIAKQLLLGQTCDICDYCGMFNSLKGKCIRTIENKLIYRDQDKRGTCEDWTING